MLVAQLESSKDGDWIGNLPELGMAKYRHELQIYINVSDSLPQTGIPLSFSKFELSKKISGYDFLQ